MHSIQALSLVGLLGAVAFSAPVLAHQPSPTVTPDLAAPASHEAPTPATAQNAGLCGITAADVSGIAQHYNLDINMNFVSQALSQPMDCGAYGDLCTALAPAAANAYVCNVWNNLAAHAPVPFAINEANNLLDQGTPDCPADQEACQEICDERGTGNVQSCNGHYYGNTCHSLPICEMFELRDIVGFNEVGVVFPI